MTSKKRRGFWLTAFLVVATAIAVLDVQFVLLTLPHALPSSSLTPPWLLPLFQVESILIFLGICGVWLWSKTGLVLYSLAMIEAPLYNALMARSIHWVSLAAVLFLAILLRPHWRYMS